MLNFYPGPSKLEANIGLYFQEAIENGILESNHRSVAFEALYGELKRLFHSKLDLPENYEVLLLSSATESWEVISQSFVKDSGQHLYNGSFGEKWFQYAKHIHPLSTSINFGLNELPSTTDRKFNSELIACTHSETANGTMLPHSFMQALREQAKESIICYDATSSMGGMALPWEAGDIWFASVQKCFGLPSGLGVFIVSPAAIQRAKKLNYNGRYNSFNFMLANARKNQTHYTPNIASVYLLKRVLEERAVIRNIHSELCARANSLYLELSKLEAVQPLVSNTETRSSTVLSLSVQKDRLIPLKLAAEKNGIILGNGYGSHQDSTVRIANFPAIGDAEYKRLLIFLREFEQTA